jgi:hypothetical protein
MEVQAEMEPGEEEVVDEIGYFPEEEPADPIPPEEELGDVEEEDVLPDGWFHDGFEAQMADVEIPGPIPGGFGWGCTKDEECLDKMCVATADGGQCTKPCSEECGPGWQCKMPDGAWQEHGMVCLPDFLPVCRPCRIPSDCWRYVKDAASVCLKMEGSPEGTCVPVCDDKGGCPEGFTCGGEVCQPEKDEPCDCAWADSNVGYETDCLVENEHGKCPGTRICTENGMSECDGLHAQPEVCNGQDDDCDGGIDEEIAAQDCESTNEHGTCVGKTSCIEGSHVCQAKIPSAESCNGVDDDCDGQIDEADALGCKQYYPDLDGDGYGAGEPVCTCALAPFLAVQAMDCDDFSAAVHPGAAEPCDNLDNDCDGEKDEGCDLDGDGYCPQPIVIGPQAVCKGVDCDDFNGSINPLAAEICDNVDNDCDGEKDEGCDLDGDGWCGMPTASSGAGQVCLHPELDCNDSDPLIHPTAADACDGIDQDCDGTADQGCDDDLDGWCQGNAPGSLGTCYPKSGPVPAYCSAVLKSCPKGFLDCDDSNAKINAAAVELCNNVDDNCNGKVDETFDLDGDGHCAGSAGVLPQCGKCKEGTKDCADMLFSVHPEAEDLPDLLGLDSDCDGLDGTEKRMVFVDGAAGQDSWPGTKDKPKRTIQAAMAFAVGQPKRDCVVVAAGTYKETLTFKSAIHVWGGYDPDKGWKVNPLLATMVWGGPTGATAVGVSAVTTVGRLDIHSAAAKKPGGSSIALLVSKSPGLSLFDVKLSAGAGAAGSNGLNGAAGAAGKAGANGVDGCFSSPVPPCDIWGTDNTCPNSPAAGAEPKAPTCGGRGDAIPHFSVTADEIAMGFDGKDQGEPSCCFLAGKDKYGLGGEAGADKQPGKPGQSGSNGLTGADGKGGSGGALTSAGWTTAAGKDGNDGTDGCGGGGGGLGGRKPDAMVTCDAEGGGGGGGGSGGRLGVGGGGGGGGGGSIALLLHKSAIQVVGSKLTAGSGGKGGNGGSGGAGGKGGVGGLGADGYEGSGKGGNGGNGGKGGSGGASGGGAGGISVAVLHDAASKPTLSTVTFSIGSGGAGGLAGKHPDGTSGSGNGAAGIAQQILLY